MTPFGAPDRPIDQFLFDAVQAHSLRTRGQHAQRVTMDYADGTSHTMHLPGEQLRYPLPVIEPAAWPPAEGWGVRPGEAAFDGARFKLNGKPLAILRELVRKPGTPITIDKLKIEAWHEEPNSVDDSNLHGQVSILRKRIRDALGLEKDLDPIPNVGGAYRLAIH